MKRLCLLFCIGIILFVSTAVWAGAPPFINFQGSLSDSGGPVNDPNLQMVFSIYSDSTGGTLLWTETNIVKVNKGNYNVLLGNQTSFPDTLFENEILYLGIKVGNDPEMTPRNPIGSTPSALHALRADSAGHSQKADHANKADSSGHADRSKRADTADVALSVVPNSIDSANIIDGTIQLIDLGQNGASNGQIIKWDGSAWSLASDEGGGGAFLPLAGGTMTGPISSTGDPEITMGKGNFGTGNLNPGTQAFVAGSNNRARGAYSVVSGGGGATASDSNSATADYSTVSGGRHNIASGSYAIVAGGRENKARGNWSFTAGRGAETGPSNEGTFVWSDGSLPNFQSTNSGQFLISASGGVGIGTNDPQGALDVSSTTGAFIVPRMTQAQRNALTAVNGMIIYNISNNQFNFYENGAWVTK